jgi:micrococcal nuclease
MELIIIGAACLYLWRWLEKISLSSVAPFSTPIEPESIKKKALSEIELRKQLESLPKATVLRIIDGDTLVVKKGYLHNNIRLDSIDCPENGQFYGDSAKYGLIKLIGGKEIHLEEHGIDDYGRTLATIYVRHPSNKTWINVNERMVLLGHAWVMQKFYEHLPEDRQNNLNRLENWARSKTVGLWRTPNPIPPWKWRKSN